MHICVDFLSARLSQKTKIALEILTYAWGVAFLVIFLMPAIDMTITAFLHKRISATVLRTPMWIPYSFMILGFIMLLLQFIKQLICRIMDIATISQETKVNKTFFSLIDNPYVIILVFFGLLKVLV